jgi:hypothetical protein
MKTKVAALILTVITGSVTAGQASSPRGEFYADCDAQLHDAYGRVAPDEQQTEISNKANRTVERSPQPAPVPSYKEVSDAQS